MNRIIGIREPKRHFSRILRCVAAGEDVVIARAGKPVARLVPFVARPWPKRLGLLAGCIEVPDDFNSPLGPQRIRI